MIKNFSDCGFLQDGGDDFQGSTTVRTLLDVDIKHPFNRRAQLMRLVAAECGASSFASDGLLFFPSGIISARNLALGASTPCDLAKQALQLRSRR
jgi:hypothetical protein